MHVLDVLEQQLRDTDPQLRCSATRALYELYQANRQLIAECPSAWRAWLSRQHDKSLPVRMEFVNAIGLLLPILPDPNTIEDVLKIDHATLLHGHKDHLKALAGRGLDIDISVQETALHSLGKLFNSTYLQIWYGYDIDVLRMFGWIPSQIFRLMDSSPAISRIVEDVVSQHILPLPLSSPGVDEVAWTKRLLSVIAPLDARAMSKLLLISTLARPCFRKSDSVTSANASRILVYVGKHLPELYMQHLQQLPPDPSDRNLPGMYELSMQVIAAAARWGSPLLHITESSLQVLKSVALAPANGFRAPKFTARFIIFSSYPDICKELFNEICETLKSTSPLVLDVRVPAILAQFARSSPTVFDSRSSEIFELLDPLLLPPQNSIDDDWTSTRPASDSLQAKILALKVYRNYGLTHASSEEVRGVVLKMLATWVQWFKGGSTQMLNVQAAVSLLHMSISRPYAADIARLLPQISLAMQASDFGVRMAFVHKVVDLSRKPMFPCHYTAMVFLAAVDDEPEMKVLATACITCVMRRLPAAQQGTMRLRMFTVLVHLLVHHPDFDSSQAELLDVAKCVKFYLDQMSDWETIGDLSKLARDGKLLCYAQRPEESRRLMIICDLAHELIQIWAQSHLCPVRIIPGENGIQYSSPWFLLPDIEHATDGLKADYPCVFTEEMSEWVRSEYTLYTPSRALRAALLAMRTSDIARLKPGQFLNDEIINFCTALFYEDYKSKPDIHIFSSFLSTKIVDGVDSVSVRRWDKAVNLISKKFLIVPVHKLIPPWVLDRRLESMRKHSNLL
ncbi:hypothetical protein B0H15DRAFT_802271 [Mycena belliarum]|uniref:Ubiquitin-like protease family profile domain-containing protein n=1 Tax=Mycena belliarum TaxID=1033014 RepID=A0AAD6U556_9AGAR|nr:hypothetical protein B0H15DRAFT_802271 [Mycena belliae]